MAHFTIKKKQLPTTPPKYLHCITETKFGLCETICTLGQILKQQGYNLLPKKKPISLLHELKMPVPPFTRFVRGHHVQTDLATKIMQLDGLNPNDQIKIAELLSEFNHTIEFID
jgi:hypothetical protein